MRWADALEAAGIERRRTVGAADIAWSVLTALLGALVAVGAGYEVRGLLSKESGDTYSEWMRPWAKRHPVAFVFLCGLLTAVGSWLPGHILGTVQ